MTNSDILNELSLYTGKFPMKAMRAAIEHRREITPELLTFLASVADDPANKPKWADSMLPVFAIYLLAQFREKSAYQLLIKILKAPGESAFDLFGDTVTEAMSRILASVYDGNATLLQELIESQSIDEYVRSAALETFLVLESAGQITREAVIEYFRQLFHKRLEREPMLVWNILVCAVADLRASDLLGEVRQAYAENLVDPMFARLEEIERDACSTEPRTRANQNLISDAIAETEWWASFNQENSKESYVAGDKTQKRYPLNANPGRNAPCPCFSGKKYKKCCGKQLSKRGTF